MKDLASTFALLSNVLRKDAVGMSVRTDEPGNLYIELPPVQPKAKPKFFGAVQVKNSYVGYHLMPVYEDPALLAGTSDALRKKMHGKSCFNFATADPVLVEELDALTAKCADSVGSGNVVGAPTRD